MCGRFTLTLSPEELQQAFPQFIIPAAASARYNISPSQPVLIVPNDGSQQADFFIWGLIPSWAKDPSFGSRMINARAETLADKPSFRAAYKYRRCIVLADGFYEWQAKTGSRGKLAHFIRMKSKRPFGFAGLWETWLSPDGSQIKSCTIITTNPNSLLEPIHPRMPVILPQAVQRLWLDPQPRQPAELQHLLVPFPADELIAFPVSSQVNRPQNDTPELITPLHE